jgi:hypothetical protein
METKYSYCKSLPKPLTRWWVKTRPCKNAVQLGPKGMPACVEFYVPWYAWPLELMHHAVFGKAVMEELELDNEV